MKFPFIKLDYYSNARKHNPIWVDIRTIAQVYEGDDGITRLCTTAEEKDFLVWDSMESVMKQIVDYYDGGIAPTYQAITAKKKSSFFDDYNV